MPQAENIIGIDLGTTNSCVSVIEYGKTVVIPNSEGERTTPSIVFIDYNGSRRVGTPAKNRAIKHPDRTIKSVKRYMGSNHRVAIDGVQYSPEQISACILDKLKKQAEEYLMTPVSKAIITVPAYFSDAQRLATRHAGRLAGLEVLRVINEPTACALAYGFHKVPPGQETNIIVFDFGGGTFDVSILHISEGIVQVKATNGNNQLGGDDFDLQLAKFINEEFKRQYGIDASQDPVARQRMLSAAETVKVELSGMRSSQVNLPFLMVTEGESKDLEMEITIDDFNRITKHIVEATKDPIENALSDAKLTADKIDKVVLCGGTTRIPAVQQFIRSYFNMEPAKTINPDEAVSIGAAIQGAILSGQIEEFLLLDVIPMSLGIEDGASQCKRVIERNTTIPVTRSHTIATTKPNQKSITVHVLQGEGKTVMGNISLARFEVPDIKPAPAGKEKVNLEFTVDADGIFQCGYTYGDTTVKQVVLKRTSGYDMDQIEKLVQEEAAFLKAQDRPDAAETDGNAATEKSRKGNGLLSRLLSLLKIGTK